ncbi:alkaline phosphatase-like [Athalia rosae]|uniref:alkaline phosphatase-like n=1 Tax=Athalia rosae TaxID=37344 RepID=UPI00203499F9|nr:alkaline phosphatase-like [Athalia rosae]
MENYQGTESHCQVRNALAICKFLLHALLLQQVVHCSEDKHFWHEVGRSELDASLNYKWNTNTAKNVIIFLGDGMSPDTITASRIYNAGEESYLSWEKFPHVGLLKTYDSDKQVPDSASTATAIFCGVKTNNYVAGVDANVKFADCEASLKKENHLDSIIAWGQQAGKDTGFVTTTRVTHATPSALFAHVPDRNWECEAKMPQNAAKCKDVARQLIEDEPGRNIKVIMGGGRQMLQSNVTGTAGDPLDTWACYSKDGRKLMEDWAADKERRNFSHTIVQNTEELFNADLQETEFLLGIFANGHIAMDWERDTSPQGMPSLENMTTTAIKMLRKSEKGYILVVEGGLIDFAHHRGHAAQALQETVRLSEAVRSTLELVDLSETLVLVTSDHTHSMTFNGVSDRGADILGIARNSKYDGVPYTILGYGTGGPNNMGYEVYNATVARRSDPTRQNTREFTYSQQATIITSEAQHGGGDVAIYAIGPYAHLFHSTHEQNFVAHVAAYSAKIGAYSRSTADFVVSSKVLIILMVTLLLSSLKVNC